MHVAIVDTAVAVAAMTEIGRDVLEVISPRSLYRDRLRDLHDPPELVVGQGDGGHSGELIFRQQARAPGARQLIATSRAAPFRKVYSARDLAFSKWFQADC